MAKVYVCTFQVIQNAPMMTFPMDMLRRDECFPATEEDASLMLEYSQYGTLRDKENLEPITLKAVKVGWPKWAPTTTRWQTFGWRVKLETLKCTAQ